MLSIFKRIKLASIEKRLEKALAQREQMKRSYTTNQAAVNLYQFLNLNDEIKALRRQKQKLETQNKGE